MAKRSHPRAPNERQAISRRAAADVLTLEARIRAAGIPESRLASVERVSLAEHKEDDADVFNTLAHVPKETWAKHRAKPHEVDLASIANLKRTVERTARALGEAPAKAGRKPANPELLPLNAAREDGEFDAAADVVRADPAVALDELHDAVEGVYADDYSIDGVCGELYDEAARLNSEELIATGAHTTLQTGKNWMPIRHDVSNGATDGNNGDASHEAEPKTEIEDTTSSK